MRERKANASLEEWKRQGGDLLRRQADAMVHGLQDPVPECRAEALRCLSVVLAQHWHQMPRQGVKEMVNAALDLGQAASAELRTAQATISTLTKDLAAARSTLAATEAPVQQAKSEAVVRGAQSVGSQLVDGVIERQALERELEEAKRSARVRAGELERAQQELKKARDDMIRKTGDAKLKALESEPRGARGGDAIDAAQLVRTASQTLLEDESGMEDPVFGRLLLSTPAPVSYTHLTLPTNREV